MYILVNFIIFPLIFLIIGLLLRLLDKSFKLSNAVYLGVVMAIFMSLSKLLK